MSVQQQVPIVVLKEGTRPTTGQPEMPGNGMDDY